MYCMEGSGGLNETAEQRVPGYALAGALASVGQTAGWMDEWTHGCERFAALAMEDDTAGAT